MGLFGGSASSSQTLTNSISYNPIINIGDDNESALDTAQRTDATSSATAKDEFGLSASAGFALGPNSQAQGGTASLARSGDTQPMQAQKTGAGSGTVDNNMLMYIGLGGAALAGVYYLAKKKK